MAGLLDISPACPENPEHGRLVHIDGEWALDQVKRTHEPGQFVRTGALFVCQIYRCQQCGAVALRDKDF